MTYEDSLTECAWCGSEHIETIVGTDPHHLALCQDCNNRYRQREPEPEYWAEEGYVPMVRFAASELAEAIRSDLLYQLCWQKLYRKYANVLDGVAFRDLVKQVRKAILDYLAGTLEVGEGLSIPVWVPNQEATHDTSEFSTSSDTCNQQSG